VNFGLDSWLAARANPLALCCTMRLLATDSRAKGSLDDTITDQRAASGNRGGEAAMLGRHRCHHDVPPFLMVARKKYTTRCRFGFMNRAFLST
jgi:hypothetical protein